MTDTAVMDAPEARREESEERPRGRRSVLIVDDDPHVREALTREAVQARDVLPDKPVNKGDRWQRTRVLHAGAGQILTFETYYEYAGTMEKGGKTLDKIDSFIGGVTYTLDPNSPLPLKLLKSDLKIDSSMGSVLFDREKGQIVESTSATRITGPITFSVNGQELPAKLDLTMETGSSVK